jgi:uncharacterized protein YqhQ
MINKNILLLPILMAESNRPDPMGGQALIEGVLMRSKTKLGASVRRKDGSVDSKVEDYIPWRNKYPILKLFIVRGAVSLFESLSVGMRYLTWSGELAEIDADKESGKEVKEKGKIEKALNGLVLTGSLLIGILLFMYVPILSAGALGLKENPFYFNLTAGAIRIAIFVGYIAAISLMKDVRRVFEYHGAEHKSILAYEAGEGADALAARKYTTLHPRCGTSFMFIAGMACVVVFAFIDTAVAAYFGNYTSGIHRLLVHLALVPLVSGISFEILKLSDRFITVPGVRLLILPGLLLQRITTREPDDSQLEIAVQSLKNVL